MATTVTMEDWQAGKLGAYLTTALGTPFLLPFSLGRAEWTTLNDNGNLQNVIFGGLEFPASTTVTITASKRIVETYVQGSSTSIKELEGFNNKIINVEGIATPNDLGNYGYAEDFATKLRLAYEAATSIPCYNLVCEFFGIFEVVLTNFDILPLNGNGQPFRCSFAEDKAVNLIL